MDDLSPAGGGLVVLADLDEELLMSCVCVFM
jgi:hypothetical protein